MIDIPRLRIRIRALKLLFISFFIASFAASCVQVSSRSPKALDDTKQMLSQADFFVATNGSDRNPGSSQRPFATLARAQRAVRQRKNKFPGRPITVVVRGGYYFLDAPLVFKPEDSGGRLAPITYRAWPGERPVFSGGVPLTGWNRDAQGRWILPIRQVREGKWSFSQLFVNGQRRLRPRWPEKGSFFIEKDATPKPGQDTPSHDRLHFHRDDLRPDWHNLDDVEAVIFHIWSASRMRIKNVDPERRVATLTSEIRNSKSRWSGLRGGHRYFLENVREALDEPGEWYLDNKSGMLTYIPKPGERPENTQVIAPRLKHLLKIEGDPANHKWVEYLRFVDLTFSHTNYVLPPEGYGCAQAEVHLDGAIRADGAHHCLFKGCTVSHVATYGIQLNTGCQNNRVEDCDIWDLGAGGVQIGAKVGGSWFSQLPYGDLEKTDAVIGGHNTLLNSTIAHGGRIFPAAVGVWIGGSPYNRVAHNDIYDFFYTGISPGWVWGYKKSFAHHNIIEQNHIHTIGQRVLSDMGGIYTLGITPGTVLRYNHIHDVYSYSYGGWGIYFDEGTTYILAENNLAYRVKDGGFHQHYGRENWVVNNIFAFSDQAQIKRSRLEEHTSFQFLHNIVYWKDAPLLGGNTKDKFVFDYNLYWKEGGEDFKFGEKTFEEWQAAGHDVHSLIADPQFVDPSNGDFRLLTDETVKKVGFVPFDISRAGRYTPARLPAGDPVPDTPFLKMIPDQKPPPRAIRDDFETTAVGGKPREFTVSEENKRAVIRVTDKTAASGRRGLKFTDAPGQQQRFNPHIYTDPKVESGTVVGRFHVRMETGGHLSHEWRTSGGSYKIGPSVEFLPSGGVRSRGKKIAQVPLNQWLAVEIRAALGSGKFDLEIGVPGQERLRFRDLPCDADFDELRWIGFVAMGDENGVFHLDDLFFEKE